MEARVPPVTVIVPCHNEASGLPALIERLDEMHRQQPETASWQFLFVDDGSSDNTLGVLIDAERRYPWVEVVRDPDNHGLGAALRTGFEYTASPIICSIDSDCTYPPERLTELTAQIESGIDLATASAWHPEAQVAEGSRIRVFLSRAVSRVYKFLVGQDVYTFTCLFRAYRREVLEQVRFRSNGFAAVAEIMLAALRYGYRVAEVPMQLEKRRFGESKLKITDALITHSALLLLTAYHASTGSRRAAKGTRS